MNKLPIHQFKRSKYNVDLSVKGRLARTVDSVVFDSLKEAEKYRELKIRRDSEDGDVLFFHRQVIFDLPGGTVAKIDFQVFYRNGTVEYIDVKGRKTKSYIRNKKQVEALYPVRIREV